MGVNPTSIAELHFPEVITDTALFSSRTSSFFFSLLQALMMSVYSNLSS